MVDSNSKMTTSTASGQDDSNNVDGDRRKYRRHRRHKTETVMLGLAVLCILWHYFATVVIQPPSKQSPATVAVDGRTTFSISTADIELLYKEQQPQEPMNHKKAASENKPVRAPVASTDSTSISSNGVATATAAKNKINIRAYLNSQNDDELEILPKYNVVFSTGCSESQNWQSYVFFYHAYKCKQKGTVTRIASGCTSKQKQYLETTFKKAILALSPTNFKLHYTPDYSKVHMKGDKSGGDNYPYFNKPFGVRHWMENALGYNTTYAKTADSLRNPNEDSIIMLLDPDQILLKPLTHDYRNDTIMKWVERNTDSPKIVQHKTVIAQQYGYGGKWISPKYVRVEDLLPDDINTKSSPLWKLKIKTASKFAAGPPYMATANDMYMIVDKWCTFVPLVHQNFNHLLAEMFAWQLAAHHVHRRPITTSGLMISRVEQENDEGWYWLQNNNDDGLPSTKVVDGSSATTSSSDPQMNYCFNQYPPSNQHQSYPYLIHYCQQYNYYTNWTANDGGADDENDTFKIMFSKYIVPKNFLSCDNDLLQEPIISGSSTIATSSTALQQLPKKIFRHTYAICTLLPAINEAVSVYKQLDCGPNVNLQKRLVLSELKMYQTYANRKKHQQAEKWPTIQ